MIMRAAGRAALIVVSVAVQIALAVGLIQLGICLSK